jgi:hypothetical protein
MPKSLFRSPYQCFLLNQQCTGMGRKTGYIQSHCQRNSRKAKLSFRRSKPLKPVPARRPWPILKLGKSKKERRKRWKSYLFSWLFSQFKILGNVHELRVQDRPSSKCHYSRYNALFDESSRIFLARIQFFQGPGNTHPMSPDKV